MGRAAEAPLVFKIIFLVILVGSGWFLYTKLQAAEKKAAAYQTAQVEKGTLITTVSASGSITTGNSVSIATNAGGVVTNVYVKNGDTVEQGQILADITLDQNSQLKQAQAWSSYLSAQNSVASAQQSKLTLQQTIATDTNSLLTAQMAAESYQNWDPTDRTKQKADNTRRAAEIALQVDQQKSAMVDTTIAKAGADLTAAWLSYQLAAGKVTAPISGVVGNLIIAPGVVISGSSSSSSSSSTTPQQLGTVTVPQGSVQAEVNLSEVDAVKVALGQKVTLTLDAFPEKTFTGKIILVNTNGQVSSGVTTYPATIAFDTASNNIYPNMSANAKIITTVKNDVVLVPSAAVQTTSGQAAVRVLRNGQIETVPVEVGDSNDTQTEITSGINEGETVVTSVSSAAQSTGTGGSSPFSLFGGGRGFGGGNVVVGGGGRRD